MNELTLRAGHPTRGPRDVFRNDANKMELIPFSKKKRNDLCKDQN